MNYGWLVSSIFLMRTACVVRQRTITTNPNSFFNLKSITIWSAFKNLQKRQKQIKDFLVLTLSNGPSNNNTFFWWKRDVALKLWCWFYCGLDLWTGVSQVTTGFKESSALYSRRLVVARGSKLRWGRLPNFHSECIVYQLGNWTNTPLQYCWISNLVRIFGLLYFKLYFFIQIVSRRSATNESESKAILWLCF